MPSGVIAAMARFKSRAGARVLFYCGFFVCSSPSLASSCLPLRYLGVEIAPGEFDPIWPAMSSSKIAFDWCLSCGGGDEKEGVTAWCKHAVRPSDVPAPATLGKVQSCARGPNRPDLEQLAADAVVADKQDALNKHFGDDVSKVECRYLGVLYGAGEADANAPALPESQLAFEWEIQTDDGSETHSVSMKCEQAWDKQRVNLPKRPMPPGKLEQAAGKAAGDKRQLLATKLKAKDLDVPCAYLGVKLGDSQPDNSKPVFGEDTLAFEWALRSGNWEWSDPVSTRCKHLTRGVALPRCMVTKQRLIDVAAASAQNAL